jgi:hypothetical protein
MTPEIAALIAQRDKLRDELKLALDAYHGLIGKIALDKRNRPFKITDVFYDFDKPELITIYGPLLNGEWSTSTFAPFKFQEPSA